MKKITILGSTGSVGVNSLSVIKKNLKYFKIKALVARYNIQLMVKQCLIFHPTYVALADEYSANKLRNILMEHKLNIEVFSGEKAICELASLKDVDQVISAIVGTAGLLPTLSAIRAGKRILLANKESLVICGHLFMKEVKKNKAQLIPLDSEHNAIFQILPKNIQNKLGFASLRKNGISKIILTGSGGPFRTIPLNNFSSITPKQACNHPNWSMGHKISVDSATMMNKGLEYIEARWLFNASFKQIQIILHPQSIIHSMIHYIDGSMLAQLSIPDMRISIAYAIAYPKRISSGVKSINFFHMNSLTFEELEYKRYPCLYLAIEAFNIGQSAIIILNAANEIAVEAFLNKKIRFTDIENVNRNILENLSLKEPSCINEILDIDHKARKIANKIVNSICI